MRSHNARQVIRLRPLLRILKGGGVSLRFARRRGPISLVANARAGARSLRLPQRIIIGFVQALDFAAVEALIPNLKPRSKGFGRA